MLIRFIAKNIFSFKEETEFNLFPNKSQALPHHKVKVDNFDFLRYSAIYGANGSGKSNLIKAISFLETLVEEGRLPSDTEEIKFKLDKDSATIPTSLAIEFIANKTVLFYTITINRQAILHESLSISTKTEDKLIYERSFEQDVPEIKFHDDYYQTDKQKLFIEVLSEKLIRKNELLITFLGKNYPEDFRLIHTAFNWFDETLVIIKPDDKPSGIAEILDKDPLIKEFANKFIPSLNTGISQIDIDTKKFEEFFGESGDSKLKRKLIEDLDNEPNKLATIMHNETGEEISLVYDNKEILVKRLLTKHQNSLGYSADFNIGQESDGTRRLIDYIPAFEGVINHSKVFIIDEIERSIHPMTIKEIIKKLTQDESVRGQLIFSTHESNLLDQSILRPDEIWFTQKDFDGSSKLYSLSDFKIHHTIKIENGYLSGRFGGIPFLGNLIDLNW